MGKPDVQTQRVRLCAYATEWLDYLEDCEDQIKWSTGEKCRPGDIQVFCISLSDSKVRGSDGKWEGDEAKIDAVHSLWEAVTPVLPQLGSDDWPVQARFDLLVRLENPVPKRDLFRASILKNESWPESYRGKWLKVDQIKKLSQILCQKNPRQQKVIRAALS